MGAVERERLLVVGAGPGCAVAVAALLVREVVATERVSRLAARATRNLAAAARVPLRVAHELTPGGRLVHLRAGADPVPVIAGREPSAG